MRAFLTVLSTSVALRRISEESQPPDGRTRRLDSDVLWDALEEHYGYHGSDRALLKAQHCDSDLTCLRQRTIKDIDVLDEKMLQGIQKIVVAAYLSLNSLKDWFPPVNAAARGPLQARRQRQA